MAVTQSQFRAALLDPAAAVPAGLTGPDGQPAGRRFDVYRNNVVASLADALGTGFPAISKLIGAQNFRTLAVAYSRAHPPRSPLMMQMGEDLPAFLTGFAPLARFGYLADVARLELALRESYHAADAEPIDPQTLAAVPLDELDALRFRLAPSVCLVASPWPIVSIWRYNMEGGAKPEAQAEAALVTRPGFDPQITALSPEAYAFLAALAAGETLGTAAARAPNLDPSGPLSALLEGRAITALTKEPAP
ncbi:MAG: DNA-binding domain-containing protein [Pseudomonadota bacterium]